MNISSIFYFSKSTSINTQYSSLWGTLKMMLFTKYFIKWKRIGRITWNFQYWFDFKFSLELDLKKIDVILVQCPFKLTYQLRYDWEFAWEWPKKIIFFWVKPSNNIETKKYPPTMIYLSTLDAYWNEYFFFFFFLAFQRFGYHVSVEHNEKHPQPKFGGNRFMVAQDMATWIPN